MQNPPIHSLSGTDTASTSGGTATAELKHLLTINHHQYDHHGRATDNPVAVAHAALQAIRDAGDVQLLFLRTILELYQHRNNNINSICSSSSTCDDGGGTSAAYAGQDEELLFHCITGARHVTLMKWNSYSVQFKMVVRDLFMTLGHLHRLFSRTIRMAFYNASSSFWKRQWNEDVHGAAAAAATTTTIQPSSLEQSLIDGIRKLSQHHQQPLNIPHLGGKDDLFRYLEHGIPGSLTDASVLSSCCAFLTVLVGEFAGKSASNYNMPLEFHKLAHSSFEKHGYLDKSLDMSMKALSHVVGTMTNNNFTTAGAVQQMNVALIVVQLCSDLVGWEFGTDAWDSGGFPHTGQRALITPPQTWRPILLQPDFVKAMFHVHNSVVANNKNSNNNNNNTVTSGKLAHSLRQLLLLLASLNGPIFASVEEKRLYAALVLDGILSIMSSTMNVITSTPVDGIVPDAEATELLDTLSMISRLLSNYKLSVLVDIPLMTSLLEAVSSTGKYLLQGNVKECEIAGGDLEAMPNREFREEALALLLEGIVVLCGDPWLLYSGSEESRHAAKTALGSTLAPLYTEFVTCRTRMARLEETYLASRETELDEVREEIYAVDLEEEMELLAIVGRLDLHASLVCLSSLFANLVPQLQSLWVGQVGEVTPMAAGLLEDSRLVTLYIGHLLTDDNTGETPVIPEVITSVCLCNQAASDAVASAVLTLRQFAELQATKIAEHPSDPRLSPLLGASFLWFFARFAPAYILPVDYSSSTTPSTILQMWSSTEQVQSTIDFLITLCVHYNCYWPQEGQVQDNVCTLLFAMAKRCKQMRLAMVTSSSFQQLVSFHCLTCGVRHSAPRDELVSTVKTNAGSLDINMNMIQGFHRLPYHTKSKLLTAILVACSENEDKKSATLFNDSIQAVQQAFLSLLNVLSTKQMSPESVDAKEMTNLCVQMYGGIARAGDMVLSLRIPKIITPQLMNLSGLMSFYAEDLSICEELLRLFRDYAEQFIAILEPDYCIALFQASAELLKSYSAKHCSSERVIAHQAEEEDQKYNDVLCTIELLIQLSTKDFLDIGSSSGMNSSQVTDMVFFGMQQIMPLMTRGLLQFHHLCTRFFELVGGLCEVYPEKVKVLPFDLFDGLLEALLMGMSHHDAGIGKCSLQGLIGIAREHLEHRVLDGHIATCQNHEGLIDKCSRRLLVEVIFQHIVWDRLESAGAALLPLAAIDLTRFAAVVQEIAQRIPPENQQRLMLEFEKLLNPELISKITAGGYEGRKNRIMFKKDFETFCHEVHAFIVIK